MKKQLATITQGNDTLALYSNKLKKLMDELQCLEPRPTCICGKCTCNITKRLEDIYCSNDVMQLLMGLNETYDAIVSNILMMDTLPVFNKAYSIVSRIEKQRSGSVPHVGSVEASALMVKAQESKTDYNKNAFRKKDPPKKDDRVCTHCGKQGHTTDTCFKKHGYPDWFKEKYPRDKKSFVAYANAANSSLSSDTESKS